MWHLVVSAEKLMIRTSTWPSGALFVDERLQAVIGYKPAPDGMRPAFHQPLHAPTSLRWAYGWGWAAPHLSPQVSVAASPRRGVTIPAGPVEGGSSGVDL